MDSIKACVRCGAKAELEHDTCAGDTIHYVQCVNCGMEADACYLEADAIELWNALTLEDWLED